MGSRDDDGKPIPASGEQASLSRAIVEGTGLPDAEAYELAGFAFREWRERGGEEEGRGDTVKGLGLVAAIGGSVLLLIAMFIAAAALAATLLLGVVTS